MSLFRSLLTLIVVLGLASPAVAQIYTWRDGDGRLVLSNKPNTDKSATYEVHGASTVRATTPYLSTRKSAPFDAAIDEHARRQGVAADLVRAVIQVESAFNPAAVSHKGAMGLMQLMPATAQELGVRDPFDPDQNIRGGVTYLKQLLNRYDQKVELALPRITPASATSTNTARFRRSKSLANGSNPLVAHSTRGAHSSLAAIDG